MAIATILADASDSTGLDGTIELACLLASRFSAHVEFLHVGIDVAELSVAAGAEGLPAAADLQWVGELADQTATLAKKIHAVVTDAAARHGLPIVTTVPPGRPSASWREDVGDAPNVFASHARFFDLSVLGTSDRRVGKPHQNAIDQTLIQSGRPVLLAPATPPASVGDAIAIGWNGSAQAVRAIVAALPLLQRAHRTSIIVVGEAHQRSAEAMRSYLHMQNISATVRGLSDASVTGPGGQLLSAALETGADLLVMGGYGHSPWYETLFGGATHEVMNTGLLPVLIMH